MTPSSGAALWFLAGWSSRRGPRCVLILRLDVAKVEDHDICIAILGMSREVAISCHLPVLMPVTKDLHDLPRFLLGPLLDQVNRVGKSVDDGCRDHFDCP